MNEQQLDQLSIQLESLIGQYLNLEYYKWIPPVTEVLADIKELKIELKRRKINGRI